MRKVTGFSALALLLGFAVPASAYIERMYSFEEVLRESSNVLVGKVESVDPRRQTAVAVIERALKGQKEYQRVQMNIGLGIPDEGAYLVKQMQAGDPFILFYQRNGDSIASCGHAGDTWFQLYASHERDPRNVWWRFTHIEVYMGRTFNGTTPELIKLTEDVLARRVRPPPPNPRVPRFDLSRVRQRRDPNRSVEVAVPRGSTWRFFKGTREPPSGAGRSDWKSAGFDDASWDAGPAPIGYGDDPLGTVLADMQSPPAQPGYSTVYLRREFQVADPGAAAGVEFEIDFDDGFILWLNGKEALAANRPQGKAAFGSVAAGLHESGAYESFTVEDPARFLTAGKNAVAVQVLNAALSSTDLKFDLEMRIAVRRAAGESGGFQRSLDYQAPAGEARGIAWADIRGDGLLDLLASRSSGGLLLLNDGAGFTESAAALGLPRGLAPGSWADYHGDDHIDLLTDDLRLFADSGGVFREDAGALPAPRPPAGAARWIDFNGDGLPDIALLGERGLILLENSGQSAGRFRDATPAALGKLAGRPRAAKGAALLLLPADYDGDGYTDILCAGGGEVLILHNEGDGTFRPEESPGIEISGGPEAAGASFADIDGDGDLDLFLPASGKPRLYRNNNDGTFTEALERSGDLAGLGSCRAAAWGDIDLDGNLDLIACPAGKPPRLLLGDGKGRFRDAGRESGLERLPPAGAVSLADLDSDGLLDLALDAGDRVVLAHNRMPRPAGRAALAVRVQSRRGLTGAVVRVSGAGNVSLGMREPGSAAGGGQSTPLAHFGVPAGACRISVSLGDGRVAQKTAAAPPTGAIVVFREAEFVK